MVRGILKQQQRRQEYMKSIRIEYGIQIQEFKSYAGQKCGYFHVTLPLFLKNQTPGDEPVGFQETFTEYTELMLKYRINRILEDEWYREMCEGWSKKYPIVGENIWEE